MKSPTVLLLLAASSALGQGTFQNLDFESANVQNVSYPDGELVHISDGVPGWNISPTAGGDLMGHNTFPLSGAGVSILGPNAPSTQILEGTYTVELFASIMGPPQQAFIFQTGQVPVGSRSILFYGAGGFGLSFAGQNIPLTSIGSGPNYTIFGGDVSLFAGQTGQLVFQGNGLLDNISFSPTAIPEPSVLTLATVGTFLFGWRLLRVRQSIGNQRRQ